MYILFRDTGTGIAPSHIASEQVIDPVKAFPTVPSAPDPWRLLAGTLQGTLAGAGGIAQWYRACLAEYCGGGRRRRDGWGKGSREGERGGERRD